MSAALKFEPAPATPAPAPATTEDELAVVAAKLGVELKPTPPVATGDATGTAWAQRAVALGYAGF